MDFEKTVDKLMEILFWTPPPPKNTSLKLIEPPQSQGKNQIHHYHYYFKYLHNLLIANIMYFSFIWLNAFPVQNEISEKLLLS